MLEKVGRWLCTAMMATAAVTATAAGVSADTPAEGKRLVVLGDSFTANGLFRPTLAPTVQKCSQGEEAWPAQLSRLMGVDGTDQWANQACAGASIDNGPGYTLALEAADAAKTGSFGARTELVALQFGVNDRWGNSSKSLWNAVEQCIFQFEEGCEPDAVSKGALPDPRAVTGAAYADRIRSTVTYIRYYAPNARIVLVGYPELFGTNQDATCVKVFGVVPVNQPRGQFVIEYLDRLDRAQREAADSLRLDFLDARALTTGHGPCAPESWVNGVLDPTSTGIPFHPTHQGDAVVAKALRDRYIR